MTIQLTPEAMRAMFPRAPQQVLDDFVANQDVLTKAGVNHTRTRLAFFFANLEHETDGFTIRGLTENINYSADRAAQIWPGRFRDSNGVPSAAVVRAKYGTAPGWQQLMFDDVYGNRMGNRPGTRDGSRFIGRGGPQWTGREGYEALQERAGLPAVERPAEAARADRQAVVCAAFWAWKNMNPKADVGDFRGVVRAWNGGYIGLQDRQHRYAGNDPIIARLAEVDRLMPAVKELPGKPPTSTPPKEVVNEATKRERQAQAGGIGTAGAGGANEAVKTGTEQPNKPGAAFLPPVVAWSLVGVGVAVLVIATILVARKKAAIIKNWF